MRKIHARIGLFGLLVALGVPTIATAQTSEQELRDEIEALKRGQELIRKDLDQIKQLLQARPQPQRPPAPDIDGKVFELGANPVKGERTAPLTLVEFTDYQ